MGNHYLVRFQDRLGWCLILERGAAFCTLSIKGLELQETSCHTVEAGRIDEQFEEAFEVQDSSAGCLSLNRYPLHSLTPLDTIFVKTYSDARNILTGVIDSPDSFGMTMSFFVKSLVWLLLHHVNHMKKMEEDRRKAKEKEIAQIEMDNKKLHHFNSSRCKHDSGDSFHMSVLKRNSKENRSNAKQHASNVNDGGGCGGGSIRKDKVSHTSASQQTNTKEQKDPFSQGNSLTLPPIKGDGNRTNLVHNSRPPSRDSNSNSSRSRKASLSSSIKSFTDSIWSDDFDLDKNKKTNKGPILLKQQQQKAQKLSTTVVSITNNLSTTNRRPKSPHSLPPLQVGGIIGQGRLNSGLETASAKKEESDRDNIDDFISDLEFGLPAVDVNRPQRQPYVLFDGEMPSNASVFKVGTGRNVLGGDSSDGDLFDIPTGVGGGFKPVSSSKFKVSSSSNNANNIYKPVMNLAGSPDFKCPFSKHLR